MRSLTMKFGGTSVGSAEAIRNVVHIVQGALAQGDRVTVVVSAMSGVTDLLLQSIRAAEQSDRWDFESIIRKIRDKHETAINLLLTREDAREELLQKLVVLQNTHLELCHAVSILGEATPRIKDAVVSLGERMSSRLVTTALKEEGVSAHQFDASDLIRTDATFQDANPNWDITRQQIIARLMPSLGQGETPVITGFIGATQDGHVTTLGRGGSDYSAAIIAAYNGSDELVIWTDVDGVMTTDPRIDKRARVLDQISYQEVGELAFYGAKVLHPKTVQPIVSRDIPIRVANTFNYSHPGTVISSVVNPIETVIKAVTVVKNVAMLTVKGSGMLGVPGIAGRTFVATAQAGASILMISQSSSEQSFCFLVPSNAVANVKKEVEKELANEIRDKDIDEVQIQDDVVIVTAVGAGMRGTPGVAGRVFSKMGNTGVNVLMIAQGSSECSISFVVQSADTQVAVVNLHDLALGME